MVRLLYMIRIVPLTIKKVSMFQPINPNFYYFSIYDKGITLVYNIKRNKKTNTVLTMCCVPQCCHVVNINKQYKNSVCVTSFDWWISNNFLANNKNFLFNLKHVIVLS